MKNSKYIGGSRPAQFRLPIEGYKSVRARVQKLLDEIANEMKSQGERGTKSMMASAETTLTNKAQSKSTNSITYECGCSYDVGIFRRGNGCKIDRQGHRG